MIKNIWRELLIRLVYIALGLILYGCSSTLTTSEKKICRPLTELKAKSIYYFPKEIQFFDINNTASLDLTTNTMGCPKDTSSPLTNFSGAEAQFVQQETLNLMKGESEIGIRRITKPQESGFQTFVGEACRAINFNFIFSVENDKSKILGCQSDELSSSAIMWKLKENNKLEVAALHIYDPLLDQVLD